MKFTPKTALQCGFSLVEMVIVIAVIGIIAAIAIPNIGSINSSATIATNQRNAQTIVSVFQAGAAVGVVWNTSSAANAANDVVNGKAPSSGPYKGRTFTVPGLTGANLTAALTYLSLNSNGLAYNAAGSGGGS